jgi:hypothetical protein
MITLMYVNLICSVLKSVLDHTPKSREFVIAKLFQLEFRRLKHFMNSFRLLLNVVFDWHWEQASRKIKQDEISGPVASWAMNRNYVSVRKKMGFFFSSTTFYVVLESFVEVLVTLPALVDLVLTYVSRHLTSIYD